MITRESSKTISRVTRRDGQPPRRTSGARAEDGLRHRAGAALDTGRDARAGPRRPGPSASSPRSRPGTSRSTSRASRSSTASRSAARRSGSRRSWRRLRRAVRRRAARRRLPAGHGQSRARPRRRRRRADRSRDVASWSSPARSRPARRSRATPGSRTASSSSAATARRSCSPTPTEAAADAAVMGCFYLAGQVCTAPSACSCTPTSHVRFVDLLVEPRRPSADRRSARRGDRHGADVQRGRRSSARSGTSRTPSMHGAVVV